MGIGRNYGPIDRDFLKSPDSNPLAVADLLIFCKHTLDSLIVGNRSGTIPIIEVVIQRGDYAAFPDLCPYRYRPVLIILYRNAFRTVDCRCNLLSTLQILDILIIGRLLALHFLMPSYSRRDFRRAASCVLGTGSQYPVHPVLRRGDRVGSRSATDQAHISRRIILLRKK